jgi:hypothetical protein
MGQSVRRATNAASDSVQDMREDHGRANARCAGSSCRTTAAVISTDRNSRLFFVQEVGQRDGTMAAC